MEYRYVKQSNLERRQAQQRPQDTFLQPPQPPLRFMQKANQPAALQFTLLQAPPQLTAAPSPRPTTSNSVDADPAALADYQLHGT